MGDLVPINDTEQQWANHFKDMANGKLPLSKLYVVTVNQTGQGDKPKIHNPAEDQMFAQSHDPATGRIIDPISAAANQIQEEAKSSRESINDIIKAPSKSSTSTKAHTKKRSSESVKPPLKFVGPDIFGQ